MKKPNWNGNPPRDNDHAREVILDAARALSESLGVKKVNIQNIANQLGVTRQTVYRHFASSDQLRTALAVEKGSNALEGVILHTQACTCFEDAVIESLIYLAKEIPKDHYLRSIFLGEDGKSANYSEAFAEDALQYSYQMLKAVHPEPEIADDKWLFELAEHVQRILMSFILATSKRTATDNKKRIYLNKWLRPVLSQ